MVKFVGMKKLLTLTALTAVVALFAGCMNKPVIEDELVIEEAPVIEEVVVEEEVVLEEVVEEEAMPEATAE